MNQVEALAQMAPLMGVKTKQVEHGPKARLVIQPDVVYIQPGDRQHAITVPAPAVKELAKFTGVPLNIAGNLSVSTLQAVMNELLRKKQRYHVLIKNDEAVSFSDQTEYVNTPPERVMKAVATAIRGEVEFNRVLVQGYQATMELGGEKQQAVERGDLVRAGALVQFSPIGTIRPQVRAWVQRLVCTNGATSNDGFAEFSYGGDDDIWQWFKSSVRTAYQSVGRVVERWRTMKAEQIPAADRAMMLNRLIKDARVTRDVAEAIHARALETPPETSYDMLNLMTWASSHVMQSPAEIMRAYNTVNQFTHETEHGRFCPVCHRNR